MADAHKEDAAQSAGDDHAKKEEVLRRKTRENTDCTKRKLHLVLLLRLVLIEKLHL